VAAETRLFFGAAKTLEANGASIANNALAAADDANYDLAADAGSYPDAEFVLTGTFSVAPTEGATLALYARPLDIDGTADAEVPETTRPTVYVGSFVVNNVTTAQSMLLVAQDLPRLAGYYVHNNGTGQSLSAGWTLKVTPRTYGPA
jgi:hypothetical protein